MDRRRFVPRSEDLEGRRLLSTTHVEVQGVTAAETSSLPTRIQRIERLPVFLAAIQQGRVLPSEITGAIQQNLYALVGTMQRPNRNGLAAFNQQIRGVLKHPTVSVAQAGQLSNTFGKILLSGGANPALVQALQSSMNDLVRVNASTSNQSGFLVSNDYALVLQVALAVGKPLAAPKVPKLAQGDDTPPRNDYTTRVAQPSLVGSYKHAGTVQIIDEAGQTVFGTAQTAANASYTVRFSSPLAPGSYVFRVRVLGLSGGVSKPSRPFRLTIQPATPQGPRALG